MGLLDDAIREHLDLKRRRGGDPAEIERAEQEALGPVRRNREAPADEADELFEARGAVGSARDEPDEGIASDLVDEDEPGFHDDDPEDDEYPGDEPDGVEPPLVTAREDDPATRVMRTADISPPEPRAPAHDVEDAFDDDEPFADEPTAEHRVGDAADDDDVLEETPEFLQDTPDHDRLWFEQRPPRDFDFDG